MPSFDPGTFGPIKLVRDCIGTRSRAAAGLICAAPIASIVLGRYTWLNVRFFLHLSQVSGDVRVSGRIGYVPQQAWIQNATVKGFSPFCFFSLPIGRKSPVPARKPLSLPSFYEPPGLCSLQSGASVSPNNLCRWHLMNRAPAPYRSKWSLSLHVHEGTNVHFDACMYMHGSTSGYLHVPACTSRHHTHLHAGTVMD